jgi:N-acyl-D-aspartate/D-glutamate deacylase
MLDLIIRGGTLVDGTGAAPVTGDVGIKDGRIAEVGGRISSPAREAIDADGALVTPGFVDVHSHYDGQFLWDDTLDPSFSHGVTTVIAGNCGVGFAPLQPEFRRELIELMEGVEDIPGVVLDVGMDWQWRSFGDYLDRLDARSYAMDVASQVAHAPVRVAVMGERALRQEEATPEDIAAIAGIVGEAMTAGAIGFSTGRIVEHLSSKGATVPGTFAADEELLAIARAMGEAGHGTFQMVPFGAIGGVVTGSIDRAARQAEHDRIVRIAEASGRPVTYLMLQLGDDPEDWFRMLAETERHAATGLRIHPQIASRPGGLLAVLESHNPFRYRPSFLEVAALPLVERLQALRDPARRAAILGEASVDDPAVSVMDKRMAQLFVDRVRMLYPLTLPLDYEPGEGDTLGAIADRAGVPPIAWLYDHLTAGDGGNVAADNLLNYADGNLDAMHDMLAHPLVISGLGDGGAHLGTICDASMTTSQLILWGRDRKRGPKLPVERIVAKMTRDNARLYGLDDRGVLATGMRADVNVIDFAGLSLELPRVHHDLPNGGPRLLQGSRGYVATVVNGTVTRCDDADTGARPGRLIRSHDSASVRRAA